LSRRWVRKHRPYRKCGDLGSPWMEVVAAKTWGQWVAKADVMIADLEALA
jgi:hypothetical protein